MRLAQVFKRLIGLVQARVVKFEINNDNPDAATVVIDVALRARRRMFCGACGQRCRVAYDRRVSCWRHLDVFRTRCVLRCEVRRVCCPDCGVRNERVPWAREASGFTRPFEDTCVWLARSAPKTAVAELMRVGWHTVGRMT